MKGLVSSLIVLFCLSACQSEKPKALELPANVKTVDGVHYLTKTEKTELVCENFTLTHTRVDYTQEIVEAQSGNLNKISETQLPSSGGLRHADKSYSLPKWKIEDFVELNWGEVTTRIDNLPDQIDSHRISGSRIYVWTPVKCLQDDQVLLSLGSGGNCTNVCEAWAKVRFGPGGEITDTKSLSLAETRILNEGGLDDALRTRLNIPDHISYADERWQYDLACQTDLEGVPGQSYLAAALPRLNAYPEKYEGEIETSRPLENSHLKIRIARFEEDASADSSFIEDHPKFRNMEQITQDMVSYKSLAIKGYGLPCEFCSGTRLDEYVFRSEDCAARWHQLALDMNTETKALGFIRREGKTVITTWPNAYFMADHLKDIEKAIFGDIDPDAFYQKAEGYISPIYRR